MIITILQLHFGCGKYLFFTVMSIAWAIGQKIEVRFLNLRNFLFPQNVVSKNHHFHILETGAGLFSITSRRVMHYNACQ